MVAKVKFHCFSCAVDFEAEQGEDRCPRCLKICSMVGKVERPSGLSSNASPKKPCITPNCVKPAEWKGLCRSCYGTARHLIDKEETTWEELHVMGLCELDAKPFLVAFLNKKKEAARKAIESLRTGPLHRTDGSLQSANEQQFSKYEGCREDVSPGVECSLQAGHSGPHR